MKKVHFNLEREFDDDSDIYNSSVKENKNNNELYKENQNKGSYQDYLLLEKNKEILSLRDKINSLMNQKLSLENKNKSIEFQKDERDYNNDLKLKEKDIEILRQKNIIENLENQILQITRDFQRIEHSKNNEINILKQQIDFLSDNLATREKELYQYELKKKILNERSLDKMTELRIKNRIIFHTENLFILQNQKTKNELKKAALNIWKLRFKKQKEKKSLQHLKKYTLKWKDLINQNLQLQRDLGQVIRIKYRKSLKRQQEQYNLIQQKSLKIYEIEQSLDLTSRQTLQQYI